MSHPSISGVANSRPIAAAVAARTHDHRRGGNARHRRAARGARREEAQRDASLTGSAPTTPAFPPRQQPHERARRSGTTPTGRRLAAVRRRCRRRSGRRRRARSRSRHGSSAPWSISAMVAQLRRAAPGTSNSGSVGIGRGRRACRTRWSRPRTLAACAAAAPTTDDRPDVVSPSESDTMLAPRIGPTGHAPRRRGVVRPLPEGDQRLQQCLADRGAGPGLRTFDRADRVVVTRSWAAPGSRRPARRSRHRPGFAGSAATKLTRPRRAPRRAAMGCHVGRLAIERDTSSATTTAPSSRATSASCTGPRERNDHRGKHQQEHRRGRVPAPERVPRRGGGHEVDVGEAARCSADAGAADHVHDREQRDPTSRRGRAGERKITRCLARMARRRAAQAGGGGRRSARGRGPSRGRCAASRDPHPPCGATCDRAPAAPRRARRTARVPGSTRSAPRASAPVSGSTSVSSPTARELELARIDDLDREHVVARRGAGAAGAPTAPVVEEVGDHDDHAAPLGDARR